jgi:hypothetical protein
LGKKYLVAKLARLLAVALAGVFGTTAAQSEDISKAIAEGIVAGVLGIVAWYLSVKHDQKLRATDPNE